MAGDRLGIPSIAIMTTQFVGAAELMARVLGADGYPLVTIAHPISSATPEEVSARARNAVREGAAILLGGVGK